MTSDKTLLDFRETGRINRRMAHIDSDLSQEQLEDLVASVLRFFRTRKFGIEGGMQFLDLDLADPHPKDIRTVKVIQTILQRHREYSVVQWPGGLSLVKTAQVDALSPAYQNINESTNFIVRGGSDKVHDLLGDAPIATPKGTITENGVE